MRLEKQGVEEPISQTQKVYAYLEQLAYDLGPNQQMPTFAKLCEELQVSISTVNRALELLEAHRILHRRPRIGIFVTPTLRQRNLAVVFNSSIFEGAEVSTFWKVLLDSIYNYTKEQHYNLSIHLTALRKQEYLFFPDFMKEVEDHHFQGIFCVGLSPDAAQWLMHRVPNTVGFQGNALARVDVDFTCLIRAGTAHLIQRGCKKIAFILPGAFSETLADTFRSEMTGAGFSLDAALVFRGDAASFWQEGYDAAHQMYKNSPSPDGVLIPSEMAAFGALTAFQERNIAIGDSLKVAVHSNQGSMILAPWMSHIARLEVAPGEIVAIMAAKMEALFADGKKTNSQYFHQPHLKLPEERTR
ncbi:MAG: GntR family transcriptional regulator [Verrucomicrobia bacterium]|nr:GntR family transcriptional regulator [Deltaproteobacteria bacterium]